MLNSEKINRDTAELFQRMLGIKQLPDFLLARYFLVKRMADKVDARLSPGDLIRIALDCGFDPETMSFLMSKGDSNGLPVESFEVEQDKAVKEIEKELAPILVNGKPPEGEPESEFTVGQTVTVLVDDNYQEGRIVNICPRKTNSGQYDGVLLYDVEIEGKIVICSADEIEAI